MADANYQKTTAASRRALRRVRYIHLCGGTSKYAPVRVPGQTWVTGATKRKERAWAVKQSRKQARRAAKKAAA